MAYQGRTGPNFAEYLNKLNTGSPLEDDPFDSENLDLQGLAMFTNADFTHHDVVDSNNFNFDMNNDANVKYEDLLAGEPSQPPYSASSVGPSATDAPFYSSYNTPIQPAPLQSFASLDGQSPVAQSAGGARRNVEPLNTPSLDSDDRSRVAAEEDKRRRNTAASARFRVKKKQREQALEKSFKDVNDRNSKLEAKVSQLEMENKWLKDLITEKNAIQSREELESKYLAFKRESEEREAEHTTGVGTE